MGDEEIGKLFIGGVDKATRQEEFQSLFETKGVIDDIILMKDPMMPDRNRGFGFVKFQDPSVAEQLLNSNDPLLLNGKALDVKPCRQRDSQQKRDDAGQPDSPNKIFVGGLPQSCSEDILKNTFSSYGEVQHVKIMKDRETGNLRGFAFISFSTAEPVRKLIEERFVPCGGKNVECKEAEHRYRFQVPDGRGGTGGGFGYGGTPQQQGGYAAGGNWQQPGPQGDAYGYNSSGGWSGQQQQQPQQQQQQVGGMWGQTPQIGTYGTQGSYGRTQGANQWNQGSYGGGYSGTQQSSSPAYTAGSYGQTQGYGDQYSQAQSSYTANQGYTGGYGGGYTAPQPQQGGYNQQQGAGYNAQGGYGGSYSNNTNNYGQPQQQPPPVQDPNASGGPMRSGYGQRVGNNAHGYHPYGK